MNTLFTLSGLSIEQEQLIQIQKKLKSKTSALWKRSFNESKLKQEKEQKPLVEELDQIFNRSYQFKIDAIVASANRLIEEHLDKNAGAIIAIAEKVLKNVAEHADVEIAANPIDAALLSNSLSETNLANASRRNLVIASDEGIKRGSLVVKANKSIIDAHLATQLNRARAILLT